MTKYKFSRTILLGATVVAVVAVGAATNDAATTDTATIASAEAQTVEAFRTEVAAKAASAEKSSIMTVTGKNGWLFFGPELRHVSVGKFWGEDAAKVSKAIMPENADPLPAILDFKAQLDKAGVELLFVPVPPKAIIYPDMLSDKIKLEKNAPLRLDIQHQEFYDELRKNGVNVLDLTSDFIAHRLDKEGAFYCKQDTHWSGRACIWTAKRVADALRDKAWMRNASKKKFSQQSKNVQITGDLWQALSGKAPAKETVSLRFVGTKTAAGIPPVEPDRNSPVILMGDSHNLVFHAGEDMHAKGAGLPDQLALELGFPVDLIAVRGSGATPARVNLLRRVRANPNYLTRKKLVIWCFSAREFTESAGWQKVPVVK